MSNMEDLGWDAELAINIVQRQKELLLAPDTMESYKERLDFKESDVIVNIKDIWKEIDYRVLNEFDIKVPPGFPGILAYIHTKFSGNQQVLKELNYVLHSGPGKDVLTIGSSYPDVQLVSVETQEKYPLSILHLHKERPLLIVTSSAS
ncbi:uncharacterized protein [Antedon mediterranea]|uniref:uncharacterized protein n=1 Tax=Antedon mediterranea TaxID=105859 RepID=UPI003AF96DE5